MKTMFFVLRSRNFYNAIREYLSFPHPNTFKSYFGAIDSSGDLHECKNTISSVFSKVTEKQKYRGTFVWPNARSYKLNSPEQRICLFF